MVLDIAKASSIVEAFGLLADEISTLKELDSVGVDGRTANAAIRVFGSGAGKILREDPYRLTVLEPWSNVDAAALSTGVHPTDSRRLIGRARLDLLRAPLIVPAS